MDKKIKRKLKKTTRKQFQKMIKYMKRVGLCRNYVIISSDDSGYKPRFDIDKEIYSVVTKYWDRELVPFVIDILYMFDTWCYRHKVRNIIGMFVCDLESDENSEKIQVQKMELLNISFEMGRGNQDFIQEIDWNLIDKAKNIFKRLNGVLWYEYYKQIVKPITVEISSEGAHSKLFECMEWKYVANKLQLTSELDERVVEFLITDALDYVDACDCYCYNPYWIFGSKNYNRILEEIFR